MLDMRLVSARQLPVFALLLSGGLLGGAYFFQYVLGYPPCQMCYWQRYAHHAVLAISALALVLTLLSQKHPRLFAALLTIAFLVSFGLAFWHVGVEFKWWEGPKTCSAPVGGDLEVMDPTKFWEEASKEKMPACSDAPWHFLGLSMAGWNALASLGGAIISALGLKGHEQ